MNSIFSLIILFAALLFMLFIVVKSSGYVVKYGIRLAKNFNISEAILGVVIISVATSLPEFGLAVNAMISGGELINVSIGDIFGANIADLTLVLGIAAIATPIIIRKKLFQDLSGILFLTALFPILIIAIPHSRFVGFLLLAAYIIFTVNMFRRRKEIEHPAEIVTDMPNKQFKTNFYNILGFVLAIATLLVAAHFALLSASSIAEHLGLAKSFIGATIVAFGTTLPELSVSVQAAIKRKFDIALGNAIGSAIANLGLILGLILIIRPVIVNVPIFSVLSTALIAAVIFVWYFISDGKLARREGGILLAGYALFMIIMTITALIAGKV
ncbi:MAG: sodium:calcium antiporter [Candidatus Nanoarchaeia archaeon]|nr:sodium:calcium antiporter [Candidatus Nanoarchaeia archaeon]MDD5239572.1 sodium:calcium antiporter [Candidatus Nanoarchaeia archaeon]